MTANTETTKPVDLEAIMPDPTEVVIGGIPVDVNRLKLREFLALMNIITTGVGREMGNIDFRQEGEELQGQMIGLLIMALPNAIDETVVFAKAVAVAKDPKDAKALAAAIDNPELDEFTDLLAAVVEQELPEFEALLGKAKNHFQRLQSLFRTRKSTKQATGS